MEQDNQTSWRSNTLQLICALLSLLLLASCQPVIGGRGFDSPSRPVVIPERSYRVWSREIVELEEDYSCEEDDTPKPETEETITENQGEPAFTKPRVITARAQKKTISKKRIVFSPDKKKIFFNTHIALGKDGNTFFDKSINQQTGIENGSIGSEISGQTGELVDLNLDSTPGVEVEDSLESSGVDNLHGVRVNTEPFPVVMPEPVEVPAPEQPEETASESKQGTQPGLEKSPALESYKVELAADTRMKIPGPPGTLKVWIGAPFEEPEFKDGMSTAEKIIPAVGETARVTPYAPDFDVTPDESICMRIHPSGSEVRFALHPQRDGNFEVGANVLLFDSDDCSGAPVPKSTANLEVRVVVDREEVARGYFQQLWEKFWEKLLEFWGWLLATLFGLIIFLIRGRLKKQFGYDAPENE